MAARPKTAPEPRLSRDVVIARATEVADAEGLDAVSMRRLAGELGVTPMALYWHFRSKDELLDGIADGLLGEILASASQKDGPPGTWQEAIKGVMQAMVDTLRRHPSSADLFTRQLDTDNSLALVELLLDILRRAGFSPEQATHIAQHALSTPVALVRAEPGQVPRALQGRESDAELQRQRHVFFAMLPADRYPRIVEAAEPLSRCDDADAYYGFGLDLLVAGIDAMTSRADGGGRLSARGAGSGRVKRTDGARAHRQRPPAG
jgi:AcrR family transcriptional regulator